MEACLSAHFVSRTVSAPLIPQLTRLDCRLRVPAAPNSTAAVHPVG
jgi:hypothetical protein